MPQYEYLCTNRTCRYYTAFFAVLRNFADMDVVTTCPKCGTHATRCVVPSSPASFRMGKGAS